MALAQGSKGETIRDAYHDTMGHRRYRQQGTTRLDTHRSISTIQSCFTTSALILLEPGP